MLSADGLDLVGIEAATLTPTASVANLVVGEDPDADEKGPITPLPNSPLLDLSEEDTFNLASNPDSPFTIFLDYNGHVTQDPLWDFALSGTRPRFGQPFTTPAFDLDNDPFSFSELELDIIQESFIRAAEDFAPFNVNVTTIEPSIADLQNDGSDGDRYGVRVAIGGSATDWFLPPDGSLGGAGGVALLGSFTSEFDTPAYAFVEGGIADPSNQALVIAHEVGHTLGLEHWGNLVFPLPPFDEDFPPVSPDFNEYYAGQGFDAPGNVSWGPILGAPFAAEVTQWSNGDYADATNPPVRRPRPVIDDMGNIVIDPNTGEAEQAFDGDTPLFFNDFDLSNNPEFFVSDLASVSLQDDLAIITTFNGFTFREDDHAGSGADFDENRVFQGNFDFSTATLLDSNFASDVATGFGLIETNDDYDFFAFDTDGGEITIDVTPNAFGANLDTRFEVYGPDGLPIGVGAQDFQLASTLTFIAETPGRYFLSVTGDAFRTNPQPSEQQTVGYSDYGSLGRYTVTVNGDLGAPPDQFEVNNSIAEATVLGTGDFSADALSIHVTGDEDFFRWQASDDGELTVSADFLQSEGDIELFIRDEAGVIIGQSIGRENGEDLSIPVLDGEVYFIQVVGVNGSTQESYDLSIDGPGLAADEFEENDTAETAFAVPDEDFIGLANFHVPGDEDFYLYQVATDSETVFSVSAGTSDIAFEILQGTTVVGTGQPSPTGGLTATLTVNAGQLLRVRVFSLSGETVIPYQLTIDGAAAVGDRLEPNSDPNTPTVIDTDIAVFNNISIHTTTDRDFFSFTAPADGTLNVGANFQDIFGDLDVRIVDTSINEEVALGSSITDNELLSIPVVSGVEYLIEAFGFRGDLVPVYGLSTEFVAAPVVGDANGDGIINDADYNVWLSQFGDTGTNLSADFNGDNIVNAADYAVWREALATTATAAAQAATSATGLGGGGHGPGCCCSSCLGAQPGAVAHDHNGDGVADHAPHDHPPFPVFPGEALPILSEPLLPPDRSVTPSVSVVESAVQVSEPVESFVITPVTLTTSGSGASTPGGVPTAQAAPTVQASDLALLLLDAAAGDVSEESVSDFGAEDEETEDQAREDAFAAVGVLL